MIWVRISLKFGTVFYSVKWLEKFKNVHRDWLRMDAFRKWMNERLITRSKKGPRTLDLEVERAKTWPLGLAILVACNRWKCFFLKNDQTRKVFVFKSKLRAAKDNIRPYTFLSFSVTKCWNKSSPISSISCPKVTTSVLLKKIMLLRIAQQVAKHLGYFCKKIGCHQLLFIAQSGHAATVQFLSIKIDLKVLNWFGRIELAEKLAEPSFSCLTSGLS